MGRPTGPGTGECGAMGELPGLTGWRDAEIASHWPAPTFKSPAFASEQQRSAAQPRPPVVINRSRRGGRPAVPAPAPGRIRGWGTPPSSARQRGAPAGPPSSAGPRGRCGRKWAARANRRAARAGTGQARAGTGEPAGGTGGHGPSVGGHGQARAGTGRHGRARAGTGQARAGTGQARAGRAGGRAGGHGRSAGGRSDARCECRDSR
jgi:hypothetical protein